MQLNDEWFDVLINTPNDDMKNVCFTNKNTIKICSSKQFWYEKFNRYNMPIINPGHSISQWIVEYKHVSEATKIANYLLSIVHKDQTKTIEVNFKFDPNDDLDNIISIVDHLENNEKILIILSFRLICLKRM